MDYASFDRVISEGKLQIVDRAVSILWFGKMVHGLDAMTAKDIAQIMENDCGHPGQNISRLYDRLYADGRTAKFGKDGFRLRPVAMRALDKEYGHLLVPPKVEAAPGPGSVIPREIFQQSGRLFLTRVVDQVNGCYDHGFYDACGVMARRLVETLLIEVYVQANRALYIKDGSGSLLTLEHLIGKVGADTNLHLTRETKRLLPEIKKIGDQSAHNPRFNARQSEIDGIKHGLRVAAEELLHLCNYSTSPD